MLSPSDGNRESDALLSAAARRIWRHASRSAKKGPWRSRAAISHWRALCHAQHFTFSGCLDQIDFLSASPSSFCSPVTSSPCCTTRPAKSLHFSSCRRLLPAGSHHTSWCQLPLREILIAFQPSDTFTGFTIGIQQGFFHLSSFPSVFVVGLRDIYRPLRDLV